MAGGTALIVMQEGDRKRNPMMEVDNHLLQGYVHGPKRMCYRNSNDDRSVEDVEARLSQNNIVYSPLPQQDSILRLNIGGTSYRIRTHSIDQHGPKTLLGRFIRIEDELKKKWADWYFEDSDEYFFERVPRYFDPIYDFFATGRLHVPKDLCFDKFMAELHYWSISKSNMKDCCSPFSQYFIQPSTKPVINIEDRFIGLRCGHFRRKLWRILEGRTESKYWKAFEITSTSFVVLSVTAMILSSISAFQIPEKLCEQPVLQQQEQQQVDMANLNHARGSDAGGVTRSMSRHGNEPRFEMVEHPIFNYVEDICVTYFILEYAVRFWVAPVKCSFAKEFLNVIDLLAVLPFIFEIILYCIGISGENVRKVRWAFLTVRLLRVLRIIRIAKLGRFSPGLANFALTLKKSKKQMQMVAIVMLTVVIFFSTLVYFLEKDEPKTTFTSIPAAFWWAVVTMSTVGYGDSIPETIAGKLVGSGAIVCGVMVLALPITIMVNNFMQVVKLREEQIVQKYADEDNA